MNRKKIFVTVVFNIFTAFLHYAKCTEITVSATNTDESLGLEIGLPVLVCHARHTGYKEVVWYKDYTIIKNGTADLPSHVLSLQELLNASIPSVEFDNPLKLQGYYWCETDHTLPSSIHDYFFRIKEVYTFVGKFVATKGRLGDNENLSLQEKLAWKKQTYEDQLESNLFGFLTPPSVHVIDIKILPVGLEVHFFLYVRPAFHSRKKEDDKLMTDEHHLLYVMEYLRNETSDVHPIMYLKFRNWTDLEGIDIEEIDLRSTLGCYEESYPMSSKEDENVVWPSARIGDVVIPNNTCSTKNGLAVTRMCTGSFYKGAKWGNPSGKCEKSADGITLQLKNIYNHFGNVKRINTIEELSTATRDPSKLGVTDLHIATEILTALSLRTKLKQQEISSILSVVDRIVESNKNELIAAKNTIRLTSRILRIFDNILEQASVEDKEIRISKRHLMLDTKRTKTEDKRSHILGLAVIGPKMDDTTLENGKIEFVTSNSKLPQHDSLAYFALPRELVLKRESDMGTSNIPCQINMIFFKEWHLFQNPKGVLVKRNYKVLPSPVMYVSISGGPAWNLTDPVHLYFKDTVDVEVEDPVCVFYDPRLEDGFGAWSSEGCEYEGYKNGYYHCECHHLSIFAVILSQSPESGQKLKSLRLGTSVYVACGASMLALSLAVVLYILSKIWRQTIDHSILFALSFCFLICIILIFISETHFARKNGCIVLAMILHYTIFTIFGWLLVQAVVYRVRFAKRTDVSEIPYFMIKTGLSVWCIPVIIVVTMWFSREYPSKSKENCWLTVSEVSKEAVIPISVLILVILCFYACSTYSLTCRFKKDFLVGDSSYNDITIKFRVAFTIYLFFVLTWIFGFFALHQKSDTLRILFSICITLTAYYLALFFIFQEISFWELCSKCKKNKVEPEETPAVQYQAKSYNSVEDTNKVEK